MNQEQKKQAMVTSLKILAASPKSRSHLEKRLIEKGFDEAIVRDTLDLLEDQKILNDSRFARDIAERFQVIKPSGRQKIAFELKRKGISAAVRNEIVEGLDEEAELEKAVQAAQSRWDRMSKLPEIKRKKNVYDFLLRRGFDFQTVRAAVDAIDRSGD